MKLFIPTIFLLFSLTTYSQNSFMITVDVSKNNYFNLNDNYSFKIELLNNGQIEHEEFIQRRLISFTPSFEIGINLSSDFWINNSPDTIKVYYYRNNDYQQLYTESINSVPLAKNTLNFQEESIQLDLLDFNNLSVYSIVEQGNYGVNIRSNHEVLYSNVWEQIGNNLTITLNDHGFNVGDYILIKDINQNYYKRINQVNNSQIVVSLDDGTSFNNSILYFSPALSVIVNNQDNPDYFENPNGNIYYLIVKCPDNYDVKIESLSLFMDEQNDTPYIGIENFNYINDSFGKKLPEIITSTSSEYFRDFQQEVWRPSRYYKTQSDFDGRRFLTESMKDQFVSNFDFSSNSIILEMGDSWGPFSLMYGNIKF